MSRLLLNENPLIVLPSLAVLFGINEAMMLQQIHFCTETKREVIAGHKWVYNSVREWRVTFPFMSESTIKRALETLRKAGVVIAEPLMKSKMDNRLFYRVNYDLLESMESIAMQKKQEIIDGLRFGQDDRADSVKLTEPEVSERPSVIHRLHTKTTDLEKYCGNRGEQETKTDGLRPTGTPEKMVAMYKAIQCDKTDVRAMTDKRTRACEKVYKFARQYLTAKGKACEPDNVYAWLRGAFKQVEKSSFLCGMVKPANGRKPFLLTFDWLMNVDNLTKLIEGQYSDD